MCTSRMERLIDSAHEVIPASAVRTQDVSLPVLLDRRFPDGDGRVGGDLVAVVGVVLVAAVGPLEPEADGGSEVPHRPTHHDNVEEGEE